MGLDIYVEVSNRKVRDEAIAENKKIQERNNKAYEEQGSDAQFEQTVDFPSKQEYYFRKFNALVDWVERNVGNVENCEPMELSKDDIESLQSTLTDLTPENCDVELPTCEGFFFGSQEYDQWYWQDVENAKQMCQEILKQTDWENEVVTFLIWY